MHLQSVYVERPAALLTAAPVALHLEAAQLRAVHAGHLIMHSATSLHAVGGDVYVHLPYVEMLMEFHNSGIRFNVVSGGGTAFQVSAQAVHAVQRLYQLVTQQAGLT